MTVSTKRLLFGTDEDVPKALPLSAGPLALTLAGGKLQQIRVGDVEIWHGVSFLYRDRDWWTPALMVERIECSTSESGFHARYVGRFTTSPSIGLTVDIEGTSAGIIRLSAVAMPTADIDANRMGICLMHPHTVAGARVEIEHVDGRLSRSTFPTLIPPWPPFTLIRAIRHEYANGCWARCQFSGDLFELEDQRNNSDASFKTYSRSNLMPRPYRLRAGVPVCQAVELKLEAAPPRSSQRRPEAVSLSVGQEVGDLPKIGIAISVHDTKTEKRLATLRTMHPALLHLSLEEEDGRTLDWRGVRDLLDAARAQLRVDIGIADWRRAGGVLQDLAAALGEVDVIPESVAVFPSERPWIAAARKAFPHAKIGGGTPHFFVQLNRLGRVEAVDFLTFTTSPIVHVADDASVMRSLQSLKSMINTLQDRYQTVATRVGPSGIGMRKSPLGGQPVTDGLHRVPLARHDPRSRALFGAAWCLGYVMHLAYAGVDAITFAAPGGEPIATGSNEVDARGPCPADLVLARLGGRARVSSVSLSDSERLAAIVIRRSNEREVLMANLTGGVLDVDFDGWPASCEAKILDASSLGKLGLIGDGWTALRRTPASPRHRLGPYSIASLCQSFDGGLR